MISITIIVSPLGLHNVVYASGTRMSTSDVIIRNPPPKCYKSQRDYSYRRSSWLSGTSRTKYVDTGKLIHNRKVYVPKGTPEETVDKLIAVRPSYPPLSWTTTSLLRLATGKKFEPACRFTEYEVEKYLAIQRQNTTPKEFTPKGLGQSITVRGYSITQKGESSVKYTILEAESDSDTSSNDSNNFPLGYNVEYHQTFTDCKYYLVDAITLTVAREYLAWRKEYPHHTKYTPDEKDHQFWSISQLVLELERCPPLLYDLDTLSEWSVVEGFLVDFFFDCQAEYQRVQKLLSRVSKVESYPPTLQNIQESPTQNRQIPNIPKINLPLPPSVLADRHRLDLPGGRLESSESAPATLLRECDEEQ